MLGEGGHLNITVHTCMAKSFFFCFQNISKGFTFNIKRENLWCCFIAANFYKISQQGKFCTQSLSSEARSVIQFLWYRYTCISFCTLYRLPRGATQTQVLYTCVTRCFQNIPQRRFPLSRKDTP